MLPTMMIGDYLFVSKWPYGYSSASFPFEFPPFEGPDPRVAYPSAAMWSCSKALKDRMWSNG